MAVLRFQAVRAVQAGCHAQDQDVAPAVEIDGMQLPADSGNDRLDLVAQRAFNIADRGVTGGAVQPHQFAGAPRLFALDAQLVDAEHQIAAGAVGHRADLGGDLRQIAVGLALEVERAAFLALLGDERGEGVGGNGIERQVDHAGLRRRRIRDMNRDFPQNTLFRQNAPLLG